MNFARFAAVPGALLALAACQPSLHSDLPAGAAAYGAIARPDAQPAQPAEYLLRAGDEIAITVFQEPELSLERLEIDEAGNISVPLLGPVGAAGQSAGTLGRQLEQSYGARYLREPSVTITLLVSKPRSLSVEGEVEKPGVYPIEPEHTLLTAMALAGSPTDTSKLDEVLVFRTINGERMGARFDLIDIRAGRMPDPQVLPGDVIVVGFSALRGLYRDILQTAPLAGVFVRY